MKKSSVGGGIAHKTTVERMKNQKVPPDGGWGWVVVVAAALNGLSTTSVIQGLGLVFKDTFPNLGMSATDNTVIINVNLAFGMLLGLVNGPLLVRFGYRRMALIGSLIYSCGITLTAFANSFAFIMVSYGMMTSIGMGLSMSAFSLAVNSYFKVKRGRAIGLAVTITGLGPIIMPQAATFLLSVYGSKGTILIFGAFTLHSIFASMLLQPLKWHLKMASDSFENISKKSPITNEFSVSPKEGEFDISATKVQNSLSTTSLSGRQSRNSCQKRRNFWSSVQSVNTVNLSSSWNIFDEGINYEPLKKYTGNEDNGNPEGYRSIPQEEDSSMEKELVESARQKSFSEKSRIRRLFKRIAAFYDLKLLRDPIYVNMMLGLSIAIFAEMNFSSLMPFILADVGLPTIKIAAVMSLIAGADLILRGGAPFIGEWLKQPPRMMYLLSLMCLMVGRTFLIFTNTFLTVIIAAIGLGIAKGIRSVYWILIVPSYVPIERLPYAAGIQMVVNGMFLMSAGPLLGVIRDTTGNYALCIIVINCITGVTVTMWLTEMLIVKRNSLQKARQQTQSLFHEDT